MKTSEFRKWLLSAGVEMKEGKSIQNSTAKAGNRYCQDMQMSLRMEQ